MNRGGGDENTGNFLMSLIPSVFPKPDLFLYEDSENNLIDVTNYKIDDLFNLAEGKEDCINILCLYESSNFSNPMPSEIYFHIGRDSITFNIYYNVNNIEIIEFSYNNKVYYQYTVRMN